MFVAVLAAVAGVVNPLARGVALNAPPSLPTASVPGSFSGISPTRLLDTRTGNGAAVGKVTSAHPVALQVLGRGGVPASGVAAVVLTVTVLSPTSTGGVTVWADDASKPATTNVAFVRGVNVANQVVTAVGADGGIDLSDNSPGTFDLVADVSGYYLAGTPSAAGTTSTVKPARILDTRTGAGAPKARVAPGGSVTLTVGGRGGVPADAQSALVDVTVLTPSAGGGIVAYAAGTPNPATSNITFAAGRIIANLVSVKLGTSGQIVLANNSTGTVDLVADVMGYVLSGTPSEAATFVSTTPARFLDTRTGVGAPKAAVASGKTVTVQIAGRGGIPATNVGGVTMTVTVVSPGSAGGMTAWPDGTSKPYTTNVTFAARQSVADLVTVPVGDDGKVVLSNNSPGTLQLVADVAGYYRADKLPIAASTSRYVRNLTGGSSDASTLHDEGCADAQANAAGSPHLMLLDIGSQVLTDSVQLSATRTVLTNAQLVTAVNGYVDGYAACRVGADPAYIALGTNNDGTRLDAAAGADWADNVVDMVAAHAAANVGISIAGANDIEPDFDTNDTGPVAEAKAEAWTKGFLGATSAPYFFIGAASGCSTSAVTGTCNRSWTQRNLYDLAHGIAPTRIWALPQIYYALNASQWKYVSLSGASGADRISVIGALSEYAACQAAGSGCDLNGLLPPADSWQALRNALSSDASINLQRLPISTDLRSDTLPGAPASAKRVTTAGVK